MILSKIKQWVKQSHCHHRWRLAYTIWPHWTSSGVCFDCTKCGKEIFLNLDIPFNGTKHIWHFDGIRDMDVHKFHCTHCGKKIEINVKGS